MSVIIFINVVVENYSLDNRRLAKERMKFGIFTDLFYTFFSFYRVLSQTKLFFAFRVFFKKTSVIFSLEKINKVRLLRILLTSESKVKDKSVKSFYPPTGNSISFYKSLRGERRAEGERVQYLLVSFYLSLSMPEFV